MQFLFIMEDAREIFARLYGTRAKTLVLGERFSADNEFR